MIAVWRRCVDCDPDEPPFGLTLRQSHSGLRVQTRRCRRHRLERRRATQAAWARNRRQTQRRPKSAPVYTADGLAALSEALRGASHG